MKQTLLVVVMVVVVMEEVVCVSSFFKKEILSKGWGYSSVVERSMDETLGFSPALQNKQINKQPFFQVHNLRNNNGKQ
jgi:hypothetical protein